MNPGQVTLHAIPGVPVIEPGDDLAAIIVAAATAAGVKPQAGDVVVIAQKIVSKAEDRFVDLATVFPSEQANEIGAATAKDPRLVEVILRESRRVVRRGRGVIIVEHRLGYVMANAGVDQSNVGPPDGRERVLMLPEDPDRSAEGLRARFSALSDGPVAVIVNDSFGRAWRRGTAGIALGAAGLPALVDLRGQPDLFGRTLHATEVGYADEIAAAASLVMGQAAEGTPVVIVRGLEWTAAESPAQTLIRSEQDDLFR